MKYAFLLFGFIMTSSSIKSQDFITSEDDILKQRIIKSINREVGVAVQKIINKDSNTHKYEIALFVNKMIILEHEFLSHSNYIVFEDKTSIIIKEQVEMNFYSEGKNNIYVIHELSTYELKLLQTKKIDYFKVSGFKISPDKWQKEKIIKTFEEIVSKN